MTWNSPLDVNSMDLRWDPDLVSSADCISNFVLFKATEICINASLLSLLLHGDHHYGAVWDSHFQSYASNGTEWCRKLILILKMNCCQPMRSRKLPAALSKANMLWKEKSTSEWGNRQMQRQGTELQKVVLRCRFLYISPYSSALTNLWLKTKSSCSSKEFQRIL